MLINVERLAGELHKAGIETCGCNSDGVVWDLNNNEIQDREDVKAVIEKHDPTPVPEETERERIKRIVKEEFNVIEKEK